MKVTEYEIKTPKITKKHTLVCISDLHARKFDKVLDSLKKTNPEIILLAGDILEVSNEYMQERNKVALDFLCQTSHMAPTYYCFGNHEIYYSHSNKYSNRISNREMLKENIDMIRSFGIHIINDSFETVKLSNCDEIYIGGLVCGADTIPEFKNKKPDVQFLEEFDKIDSFKILLCHYPHYYDKYLKNSSFDLIFSGHAHGGHWRFFGQGIYSPHQGLFPKLTSGIHDGRLIISRGAVNNSRPIPRFFNPTEIIKVNISK